MLATKASKMSQNLSHSLRQNASKCSQSLRAIFAFSAFFGALGLGVNVAYAESIDSKTSKNFAPAPQTKPKNTQNLNVPIAFARCIPCHGENGQKVAPGAKGGATIAGLNKQKLIADLRGYRAKRTDNGGAKFIMYSQAENLSDADIEALASYISSLPKKREQNTK